MTRLAFTNGLLLALETIRSHKLRAFLTVLGVIVGTGTIIGVGAILTGFGFINAHYKGNDMYDVDLFGVEEAYANGGQADIHVGRFFTDEESRRRAPVVVIGADVEQSLFANIDPVGKIVNVDGHQFEVIGTMQRPAASFFGDQDKRVLLPYWSMQKMFPNAKENAIVVTAREGKLPQALDEIVTVLRIDRHVPYNKPDNFALSTAEQMIADFRQITAMTFLVMVVLSSVGLLVGGIGVMNIMLVSVTERTQEIGLRKAVGAKRADIVIQFLLEASVLTSLGGIAGIIFGWVISVVSRLVFTSLPATVPLWAAALGIIVSVGVGLFFGIWPAYKAARLDPVEALRYE